MSAALPTEVDVTNCEAEPIHIPGSIQPHGVLLALREPELTVVQASESVAQHLGQSCEEIVGAPLAELMDPTSAEEVRAALASRRPTDSNPIGVTAGRARFDGIVHRHEGVAILELEPALAKDGPRDVPLRLALADLQSSDNIVALCGAVVQSVRRLTGFERVMLYRFDEDGHGSVEAEAKDDALVPYLGQHYPASDIPPQARALYLKSWLRIIPDARYRPSLISPVLHPDTNQPLDLSFSVLRSVSPIHLEYLANMGVLGSMSISLVVRDRLWGLVACTNHSAPRFVGYEVRSACEAIGRLVSLQIAALDEQERAALRRGRSYTLQTLAEAMSATLPEDDLLDGIASRPESLLALVDASGAAIIGPRSLHGCGRAPPESFLVELCAWLDSQTEAPFATSALASLFPPAASAAEVASGLLSIELPGAPRRRIVWFRQEMIQTILWGGDPHKAVEADRRTRLHPRRSFELWKEEVRQRALPWTASDLEAAEELRRRAVEIDLERQLARAQQAVRVRDDLVAVVSHDLRNPLNVVQMQTAMLLQATTQAEDEPGRRLRAAAERMQRAIDRMNSLIRDLLDLAKIEAGRFELHRKSESISSIIDEASVIMNPLAEAKNLAIVNDFDSGGSAMIDRDRMFQVLSNVVGNAIKFTPDGGRITVGCRRVSDEFWITITDTGPGIAEDAMTHVFDRYWQAPRMRRDGSGLGLYISKGIVEAHGGRIWVERAATGGARFIFTIPSEEHAD